MKLFLLSLFKPIIALICMLFYANTAFAAPANIDWHIKVDQFGYQTKARKVAVISNPQQGFNAAQTFTPGTNTYQIRRWADDVTVFSGAITAWNAGNTHTQSGDKAWLFDFSGLLMAGEYYVFDNLKNVGSAKFIIADNVYNEVLKQATRVFFYQRCNVAKTATHAGIWADAASHLQDARCRSVNAPNDATTEKDLSGGWFDAGDFNKYVNFTYAPLHDLLSAFERNPAVFKDNWNIPESNNAVPDLLDEVKWELDWLIKMQLPNGSVLSKVSVLNYEAASPPSADLAPRYWGAAAASATRTTASIFAHAAIVYATIPSMAAYANTLKTKAELAWTWVVNNPTTSSYNNAGFQSANPEMNAYEQDMARLVAAIWLYKLTGNATYRTFVENNYTNAHPLQWNYWYAYEVTLCDALIAFTDMPNVSTTVKTAIRNSFEQSIKLGAEFLPAVTASTDPYQAHLKDDDYVWGSNSVKSKVGNLFYNAVVYNIDTVNRQNYQRASEGYLHYLHGVNPLNMCYLTNAKPFGADSCATEMYHGWFGNGTVYDRNPAPGYITGGANKNFRPDASFVGVLSPPQNQPVQKSYKDWNTSFPQNSWELTEPAIYYQAAYIKLISHFTAPVTTGELAARYVHQSFLDVYPNPVTNGNFTIEIVTKADITNAKIEIVDLLGRNIETKSLPLTDGIGTLNMNLEDFSSRIAVIRCKVGNEILNKKVVIRQ